MPRRFSESATSINALSPARPDPAEAVPKAEAGDADKGLAVLTAAVSTLPGKPGVYRMINAAGDALYVGKAKNLKKRVTSYLRIDRVSTS